MKHFLFSVDLEEFDAVSPRRFRRTPLPELAGLYLDFLRKRRMQATFFVVGQVARAYPDLIRAIIAEGHEIACHTNNHRPLTQHTPASFREDLQRNLDALQACCPTRIEGFRAPVLSLTRESRWAYEALAQLGFTYSSSVLPSRNPLHGWPGFGDKPRRMEGVMEIPVTLARVGGLRVPIGAGTYFRCLPFAMVRSRFHQIAAAGNAVVGYFHPYDCDCAQEWVMNKGVRSNPLLNALLYINRSQTLKRLEVLAQDGFKITTYHDHLSRTVFPDTPLVPAA